MKQALGSFQKRVARRITGRQPMRREKGGWDYPPLVTSMEEVVLEEIGVYILKMQNTVTQYITMQPILDLCERSVQRLGAWFYRRWWE